MRRSAHVTAEPRPVEGDHVAGDERPQTKDDAVPNGARQRPTPRMWAGIPRLDVGLAGVLMVLAFAETAVQPLARHPQGEILAAVAAGSVVLRRRAPLAMCLVASASVTAFAFLPGAATPLWTFGIALVVAFSAGAHLDGRDLLVALTALLVSGYALQVASDSTPAETALSPLLVMGAPALAGALLRRARQQAAQLRSLAEQLEREREHHAAAVALAERHRIARELHDVIAHTVSTMVVQAGAAQELLPPDSPAREPVTAVRRTGREAMGELRRLLGVLRSDEAEPAVSRSESAGDRRRRRQETDAPPQPGRDDGLEGPTSVDDAGGARRPGRAADDDRWVRAEPGIDDLAALVAVDGVGWQVTGEPYEVGTGPGLVLYRICQEALTNARRHAPDRPAAVTLAFGPDAVELRVANGVAPDTDGEHRPGHGLTGMHERVVPYGGRLEAGIAGAEWVVTASMPRTAAEENRSAGGADVRGRDHAGGAGSSSSVETRLPDMTIREDP